MARIAIDVMGGDYAPKAIMEGALWAAQEYGVGLELVGQQDAINAELERIRNAGCIYSDCGTKGHKRRIRIDVDKIDYTITHASEVIGMGEAVGQSIRKKKRFINCCFSQSCCGRQMRSCCFCRFNRGCNGSKFIWIRTYSWCAKDLQLRLLCQQ